MSSRHEEHGERELVRRAPETVKKCRRILAEKSQSFHWASKFLPRECRDDAVVVYAFCRKVDDLADQSESPERARRELFDISIQLERDCAPPVVAAFRDVARRRGIGLAYARELIRGVHSDLGGVRIRDDRELLRYCYRVAGTVGLMMNPLLGVEDPRARPHAVDLGVAMQLTNICRDVREDAASGRVYLPAERLVEAGTTPREILTGCADPRAVARVVEDLLEMAERYYRSGRIGTRYIPPRSRLAILVASRMYRAIGLELTRRDFDPIRGRASVGTVDKFREVGTALGSFVSSMIRPCSRPAEHEAVLHRPLAKLPGAHPPRSDLESV